MFMTAENPLLPTQKVRLTEQDDTSQCSLKIIFQNILTTYAQIPFFKSVHQLETKTSSNSQRIGVGKLISKKMRTKLLNWMENLALQTFGFSVKTLILSIKILDQYLSLTNESPSTLQLIGCSCLYLAAKTYESTIVACQCYVTASAKTFTEKQLFDKELEIYKTIGYSTNFVCSLRVYKCMVLKSNYTILNNCSIKDMEKLFFDIAKNTEFSLFQTIEVISMILALSEIENKIPTSNELLQKLKDINLSSNQPHC